MWAILIIIVLSALVLFNLIRIMIFGKSIIKPDFERIDEIFSRKTGFTSQWNTWYGKSIYYILLTGLIIVTLILIYAMIS